MRTLCIAGRLNGCHHRTQSTDGDAFPPIDCRAGYSLPFRSYVIGWGAVAICSRIRRDDNIVYSSSLLAKGFFPETHMQMMNKIRIKIRNAVMNAVPFSPKNFNEMKKSIGCIIARRSKNGVLSVLSPIGRHTLFLNINDWAALPLLMLKSITLPIDTT